MNFDAMGNYYGQVNDVLEQPDTEANVKPVTQTITTDPKTGEQMMTVKGRPEDLSAANPKTPTFTFGNQTEPTVRPQPAMYKNLGNTAAEPVAYQPQPVPVQQAPQPVAPVAPQAPAPDQTYQRMIQAESGGQNYTPTGAPLTSPKGAMFAAQVMPATAANPGYGIRPAQAQTPEEYNRVGQDYYNAMLQKFGNPQAAAAAYNAGPGRVQQNLAANNGQLNVAQLPQETQDYLRKVQAPAAPVAPAQPMIAGTPSSDVGLTPTEQAVKQQTVQPTDQYWTQHFIQNQNDPAAMARLRYDKNAPEWARTLASEKEYADLRHKQETERVKTQFTNAVQSGDTRAIANMINPRKETEEGSIAKAFLYSLIGFQSGAAAEVEKMGLKDKWDIARLGNEDVTVKYNPRGEAKEAIYTSGPMAGQRVSAADLEMLHGQGVAAGKGKADVSTQDVERNGVAGRVVTEHRGGKTQTYVESGGQRFPYDTSWTPRSISTAGAKADINLINVLKEKYGTNAINFLDAYQKVKGVQPKEIQDEILFKAGFGRALPTGQLPTPPQLPATGNAPVKPAVPAEPGAVEQGQGNQGQANRPNMAQPLPGVAGDKELVRQPVVQPVAPTAGAPVQPAPVPGGGRVDLSKPLKTMEMEAAAEKPNIEQVAKNRQRAEQIYPFVTEVRDLVNKSTGSGIGSLVDKAGNWVGYTTDGAEAIAAIKPLANKILMGVERFEGPQSNIDVQSYKEAAGQLSDPNIPARQKQAAFNTIVEILERNAPDMDWSQLKQAGGTTAKTGAPKSGTTKTINGVTYEYDGRGWKKSTGI